MGSIKAVVKVKVFRLFEYPKSMLHKTLFIQDAIHKAQQDMQIVVNEIVNNDHEAIHLGMFEFEAIEEPGYRFRKPLPEVQEQDMVNTGRVAKALTNQKMEVKYGPLNHEINPGIYEHEDAFIDPTGHVLRPEAWYFRADIEREYYIIYDEFNQMLRSLR